MNGPDFEERKESTGTSRGDNLALLYQGIIAVAGRVRSGEQPMGDVPQFRQGILKMREEIEKEALRRRYDRRYLEDATYAVFAFVDESIYSSNDPGKNQWGALQSDVAGKAVGGVAFFNKADDLLRQPNSQQLADVLEVYLICLLLGYQGRFGKLAGTGMHEFTKSLQARIDLIRGPIEKFSPHGIPSESAQIDGKKVDSRLAKLRWAFVAVSLLVVTLWIAFRIQLGSQADRLVEDLKIT